MSIENIEIDCLQAYGAEVEVGTKRLSLKEAKILYDNRTNKLNNVESFVFDLSELKSFVDRAVNENAKYVRVWKGGRDVFTTDDQGDRIDFRIEDLVLVPVQENGDDFYLTDGLDINDSSAVNIISKPRPCPEWCNLKGLTPVVHYFHKSLSLTGVTSLNPNSSHPQYNPYPKL